MAERVFFIVVVLILKFNGEIFAQQKNVEKISPLTEKWERITASNHLFKDKGLAYKMVEKEPFQTLADRPVLPTHFTTSLTSYYVLPSKESFVQALPFFCRAEYRFEKATSVPFKFRLGSIDYTDYLEQKPNAVAPRK